MKAKITRLLLSAVLMMCCTVGAWAGLGTPPDDEIWYTSRDGNVIDPYDKNVFGATYQSNSYNNGKGVIKFNGPVTKVGDNAFYDTNLTSISLPNSVKSIGYRAFYWMDYMKEISLGNSVETISNDAFYDCDGLETIAIPASVTSIGENAFYDCKVLKAVYMGNSVTTIGKYAFYDCDALETIAIPASVTSLGDRVCYDCDNLKFAAIGRGVTNIGECAFYNCNELKSVAIEGNGVTLGYEAFYHCDKLESVSFLGDAPPSSFGDYCFSNCSANLKYHVLEECYDRYNNIGILNGNVVAGPPYNEIWYTTNNGGTAGYTGAKGTPPPLNAYMGNHGVQFFDGNPPTFDNSNNCFYYCNNLVSVVLPSSINSIGESAFDSCENLVSVFLPNSVTSIDMHAFFRCYSLQTITIPESVDKIGYEAFLSCDELRSVTILGTINSIASGAFYSCDELRSMTILGTINSIDSDAFYNCKNLSDIFYFGEDTPTIVTEDYPSFAYCPATIYVKDVTGHGNWGDRPVRSWRSGMGDGSRENPLEIENYLNLYGFALEVSMLGSKDLCGKLTSDIVGNSNVLDVNGNLNSGTFREWLPIGSSDKVFCGEFDGNGHTISGLYHNHYDAGSCVGLFGRTGEGAYIHDLGLIDSYMSGGGGLNGGICGDLAYGRIDNCYNAATVAWGGGIAGWCRENASITNCYNVGHVFSQGSGITDAVFKNPNVTYSVENCYALEGVSNSAINNNNGTTNKVEVKSTNAFASGEVCWLLNGSKIDTKWRQQIGKDSYPVFFGNLLVDYDAIHEKYYNGGMCDQSPNHIHFLTVGAEGTIPTTTETGRYGYYKCIYCNNEFMDKHGCIPATPESLIIPKAKDNEIWYTTSNNQKLTPNKTDVFGAAYNDANNVYELGVGHMLFDGNVTSIGYEAFYKCSDLTSITIPNSVTSIGYAAFDECKQLSSVVIPSGVTSIGDFAFAVCSGLTSVTIPEGVTSIGERAFVTCESLTSVTIPSSVTSIGRWGFNFCSGLESVTFKSLPELVDEPFNLCANLTTKILDLTDSDKPYVGTSTSNYPDFTEARYRRTLEKDKWETIVFPFVPTSESIVGLEFYTYKTVLEGRTVFMRAEAIEAGVPYLVKNVSDSKTNFTFTAATPSNIVVNTSDRSANSFTVKGTFQSQTLSNTDSKKFYCLDGDRFKVISGEQEIDPFRVYFETENMEASESLEISTNPLSGNGTADNPYQISNREELEIYVQIINLQNSGACGKLTADITVNTDIFDNDGKLNGGKSFDAWTPIGTAESPFTGTLDGNGHTISGLYQKETSADAVVGFMGYVGTGGNVKDIIIRDSYLFAGSNMGKLCYNNNGGTLNGYITMGTLNGGSIAVGNTQTAVTDAQFGSGEVCWLLNGGSSENVTWHQTLGESGDKYPTLAAEGIVYLTARKCDGSVKAFSNTKPESVVQDKHTCTKVEKEEATCTKTGNIQYWHCDACGKNFADEDGVTELTDEQILLAIDPDNHSLSLIEGKAHCEWCELDWEHYLAQDDKPVLLKAENDMYSLDKVKLLYGHSYLCTDEVNVDDFSYTFPYYPNVWNSWFVPFEITTDELGVNGLGFTAAYIAGVRQYEKDAEGNVITQVDVIKIKNGKLRAGTPYLIRQESEATEAVIVTFNKTGATLKESSDVHPLNSATTTANYDFIGTYNTIAKEDVKSNYYILGSKGTFVHPSSPVYAMNWYMKITDKGGVYDELPSPSQAKSIIINVIGEEDETTGIRTLYPAESQIKEVYDLSGRRLDAPRKGQVNIINGKKVFVK